MKYSKQPGELSEAVRATQQDVNTMSILARVLLVSHSYRWDGAY